MKASVQQLAGSTDDCAAGQVSEDQLSTRFIYIKKNVFSKKKIRSFLKKRTFV